MGNQIWYEGENINRKREKKNDKGNIWNIFDLGEIWGFFVIGSQHKNQWRIEISNLWNLSPKIDYLKMFYFKLK